MQTAEVVLDVLRERGRKGLPCTQLYRQMFNKNLYLLAYGNIYSNQGAMTPGASEETADGMSEEKIEQIIGRCGSERYRFSPARRVYIPKKNGKLRPLGLPSWSDKLVGEVVRLLLEAYLRAAVLWPVRTGSGKDAVPHRAAGNAGKPGPGPPGSSREISPTASGRSTTRSSQDPGGENPRQPVSPADPQHAQSRVPGRLAVSRNAERNPARRVMRSCA